MITELFYSHILNINRGPLHKRGFGHIHLSVFRYRLIKMALQARKVSGAFKKWAPGHFEGVRFSLFLCFTLMSADTRKELGLTMQDTRTFVNCITAFCCSETVNVGCNYDLLLIIANGQFYYCSIQYCIWLLP